MASYLLSLERQIQRPVLPCDELAIPSEQV
jgi:hypothetical protein